MRPFVRYGRVDEPLTPYLSKLLRGREPLGLLTYGNVKLPRRDRWSVGRMRMGIRRRERKYNALSGDTAPGRMGSSIDGGDL